MKIAAYALFALAVVLFLGGVSNLTETIKRRKLDKTNLEVHASTNRISETLAAMVIWPFFLFIAGCACLAFAD